MAVLADDPDAGPGAPGGVEQRCAGVVEFADEPGHVAARRAEPLRVVVEVRQVDERQVGPLRVEHLGRAAGDPVGAGEAGARSPEGAERELAELAIRADRSSPSGVPAMPNALLPSAA